MGPGSKIVWLKNVSKFTPKKFYEIDSKSQSHKVLLE